MRLRLDDEHATLAAGRALAAVLSRAWRQEPTGLAREASWRARRDALVVFLGGPLGAGKTTLARGLVRGLGYAGPVKSPTYTLVEPYRADDLTVHHLDLYRMGDPEELEYLGARDFFSEPGLCLVEWPERGAGALPEPDLSVRLSVLETGRALEVSAPSALGAAVRAAWRAEAAGTT